MIRHRAPMAAMLAALSLAAVACDGPAANAPQPYIGPAQAVPIPTQAPVACGDVAAFAATTPGSTPADLARRYLASCGAQDTLALTRELVRFPTVSAELPKAKPAFADMARYLEQWARAHGLQFRSIGDHDVWELWLGEGAPHLAFVMHGDVVPVGDDGAAVAASHATPTGWSHPPFDAALVGDRLYGRGTEDDKGPIAAVLVAMRTLAALKVAPRGKLMAIIGNGEESNWDGMKRYVESEPKAKHVISIDAEFPVVIAESGFVSWKLAFPEKVEGEQAADCLPVLDIGGGKFLTQVPGEAYIVVPRDKMTAATSQRLDTLNADPRIDAIGEGPRVRLRATGTAVHSSVAARGDNALWRLATATAGLPLCRGGATHMLSLLRTHFSGDHYGQKLGLAQRHPMTRRLLVAPTVLRVEKAQVVLKVNMRRPAGMNSAAFGRALDDTRARLQTIHPELVELEGRYVGEPALADTAGPLVPTLMGIYRELTGDTKAAPIAIRGGTYARLFPGAVSFGPSLPHHRYRGHAPDEYVTVAALGLMTRATLEAALRLQ